MKNLIKILFIALGVLTFSACTTTKSSGAVGMATGTTTSSFAQQSASRANDPRLRAPSNQTYNFDSDSDIVHGDDISSIEAQANYLAAHPNTKVRLAGHADERGSRGYNLALGRRRAEAIACIMQQQGVAPRQIDLASFGEEKPVAVSHNEASWRQNRRVNLTYKRK